MPSRPEIDAEIAPEWFHEGQLKAWQSTAQDVVVVAGTQGGKTSMQPYWLLREIQRCGPLIKKLGRAPFIYAGPTLTLLEQQAIPAFRELFEEDLRLGKFTSGNKPKFVFSEEGCKRLLGFVAQVVVIFAYTNDSSNLESVTALGGVWDEAGQKENRQSAYRAFNRRLKVARSQGFGRRLWGTTPYEWGWFKQHVVDLAESGHHGYELFSFPSWMNPTFDRAEADKELELGMPMWEWSMMYEGRFTRPKGIIFDCLTAENIIPADPIPKAWKRFPGVDFGNVNTAAVKVAAERQDLGDGRWGDPTGKLIVYFEYSKPGSEVKEHAEAIKKDAYGEPEPRGLIGAGGSHQEAGWRQAFRAQNIVLLDPPANIRDVEVQIQCTYREIASKNLLFHETLHRLLDQLGHMSRELDDSNEPTKKIKDESKYHFVRALTYVISSLRPPRGQQSTKVVSRFKGRDEPVRR